MFGITVTSLDRERVELAVYGSLQLGPATRMLVVGLPVLFGRFPTVVLDVGGVTCYDAAAIAALKLARQLARQAGSELVLNNVDTKDLLAAMSFLLNFDCAFRA